MISSRKLVKMARKWQRLASLGRKRITIPRNNEESSATCSHSSNSLADKGHFIVYTADKKRYAFPIAYLNNYILRELLLMAEEEFGLSSHGPITLPCDALFMDYAVSLIQKKAIKEVEKALLIFMDLHLIISNRKRQAKIYYYVVPDVMIQVFVNDLN